MQKYFVCMYVCKLQIECILATNVWVHCTMKKYNNKIFKNSKGERKRIERREKEGEELYFILFRVHITYKYFLKRT